MIVIGLNAFHGDSSACLFIDGEMKSAVEEERFRRIKHWAGFPSLSIKYCLSENGLSLADVDVLAINTDPKAARGKKIRFALSGQASFRLIKEKLLVRKKRQSIETLLAGADLPGRFTGRIEYVEHHLAHLASAFHVSPYEQASVISVDGFGDFASCAWGIGSVVEGQANVEVQKKVHFPHSLGLFYQAMTQFLGFPHYGDEYKVMGLAPYGKPSYSTQMDQILHHSSDGGFSLNLAYFQHHKEAIGYEWDGDSPQVSQMFSDSLGELFDGEFNDSSSKNEGLTQKHFDLARSIQDAYERAFFSILNCMHAQHGGSHLAIAGGCGMNSVANGKVHLATPYQVPYVQSAAGDAGGAIGAAIIAGQRHGVKGRYEMSHSYWGPSYSDSDLKELVIENTATLPHSEFSVLHSLSDEQLFEYVSDKLIEGCVVGWFQGAMEWGPRALGNRSILGDPRRQDMKDILNLKIKRRESFRPFAPSVLAEHVSEWFESDGDVPFMMKVFQIQEKQRERIPAVAHVDGSGRLQTVRVESNPRYYGLISRFHDKTGVPMLLNTSFNENEPVVCSPDEALACFLRTNMDVLVLGSSVIFRNTSDQESSSMRAG